MTMHGRRVLVVDDDPTIRNMVIRGLSAVGHEVDAAEGREEARRMLRCRPYDHIFLDLRMPGMGGLEVLEKVKKDFPRLEVIILTGHGSDEEEREAERLGAFAYLQKPVDFNDLMEVVAQAGRSRHSDV